MSNETKKQNVNAQVTGFMTINDSSKLPLSVKQKVVSAPEGHVRKFRKELVDPETGEKVVLEGRAYIGGLGKDGKPIGDRKQSLTCRIAFKVKNIQSLLSEAKSTEKESAEDTENELLAALL